jgi:hypothetical protein
MKQTAVEWLFQELWDTSKDKLTWYSILEKAKEMESDREYEIKAFWFGRGINAGRENKIEELKPKKD